VGATLTEIVEQQINAGINRDWDTLRALYADDVVYRDPEGVLNGSDAAIENLQRQMAAFPDAGTLTLHHVYESGDGVAVAEWTVSMRNTGPLALPDGTVLPATDRHVSLDVVTIYEISDGRITSERNYWDSAVLLAQLGLLPE
jgi:steroid delta-isomerase-like uncharacterized protein